MSTGIERLSFTHVCELRPEFDERGRIVQYRFPADEAIPKHKHGDGPFCRFDLPPGYENAQGV